MKNTDFLDVLGIPDHADTRAIKRAYAALLKRIDPAADPDGFARLREAYEQAMSWAAEQAAVGAAAAETLIAAERETEETTLRSAVAEASPTDDLTHTLRLADAFAASAQRTPAAELPALLSRTVSSLRLGYIDAPGRFEERMIDLLIEGNVGQRLTLFAALTDTFHWAELGHLAPLASRGAWIERVTAQELAWRQVPTRARQAIVELLRQAEVATALPPTLIREWPRVATALADYPDYLGLHLGKRKQTLWRERFAAQDDQPVPQAPGEFRRRERHLSAPVGGLSTVAVLLIVGSRLIANGTVPLPSFFFQEGPAVSAATVDRERLARCTSLYAEMDRPKALDNVGDERAERMRDEAERCLRLGYWHRPGKPTPPP